MKGGVAMRMIEKEQKNDRKVSPGNDKNITNHCIRLGKFGSYEEHRCFQCMDTFYPLQRETCPKCNWKKCNAGHCGCTVSMETKEAIDTFYGLFCKQNNYSPETRNALFIMLNTFNNLCIGCLKYGKE